MDDVSNRKTLYVLSKLVFFPFKTFTSA